jgi:phage terminase large subunit
MLRTATQEPFFDLLNELQVDFTFNKGEQEAELFGHKIFFRTGEHPDRLRGPNLMWAWLDEPAMQRQLVWKVIEGRLRRRGKPHTVGGSISVSGSPSAWITGTPAGFNWVHDLWVQSDDPRYRMYTASTAENIYLPPEYVADLEASYSGEFAAQELHGEFVAFEGLVYAEFRQAIHLIEDDPNPRYHRVRAVDYGYTNPFVCLWGAVDEDGRLYVYDEHYQRRDLIENHAASIKGRGGSFDWTVADHDAQDNAQMLSCGIQTIPAKKEVSLGIQRVKSRLVVQRDGRPRLFIHPRCVNLLREIGMYRWKENGKDEPVKEHDHAMDALRYMVMQLEAGSGAAFTNKPGAKPRTAGLRGGGNW